MKKFIKAVGIIAVLGSVAIASTSIVETGVTLDKKKDATTVNACDPILHLMGICRDSQPLTEN